MGDEESFSWIRLKIKLNRTSRRNHNVTRKNINWRKHQEKAKESDPEDSVTRVGNSLDFGQLFKAFGNN